MIWRCVFGAAVLFTAQSTAGAAPQEYCRAYAIDFADVAARGSSWWQKRYESAEKACLMQFTFEEPEEEVVAEAPEPPIPTPKPKKAKPVKVAAKAVADDEAAAVVQPAAARKRPNIKDGSDEWYDYCARKYASFNRKTGTYTSRSGVERRCLVTADFQ
jgi:hypothetical protein